MRLSAEMYEQIVAALRSDSHRDKDKRREPRVGLAAEAAFVTVGSDGKRAAGAVRVRDVSPSGIGLFFSLQIANKQRFVVQLYTSNDDPVWLICHAAYCRHVDGKCFSVGARIDQVLRKDEIQKVEAQAALASASAAAKPAPVPRQLSGTALSDIERISRAILG